MQLNFFKKKVKTQEELELEKKKIESKNIQKILKRLPRNDRKPYLDYLNGNILCPMRYSELLSEGARESLAKSVDKEYFESNLEEDELVPGNIFTDEDIEDIKEKESKKVKKVKKK